MPKVKNANAAFRDELPWLTRLLEEIEQLREREHVQPSLPFSLPPEDIKDKQPARLLGKRLGHARLPRKAGNLK